eukprot:4761292-Pleurochrysis_carterae.AAC.2
MLPLQLAPSPTFGCEWRGLEALLADTTSCEVEVDAGRRVLPAQRTAQPLHASTRHTARHLIAQGWLAK